MVFQASENRSMEVAAPVRSAAGNASVITWEPPGKAISVQLNAEVIEAIHADMMRGFTALPVRGAEIGGLLLGSVERGSRTAVHIDAHLPVECEYFSGPSWRLSANDEARLAETIAAASAQGDHSVVGFYRSHTRKDLSPDDSDLALFANYFPDPASVMLLIKPFMSQPGIAGFFFREEGRVHSRHSYLEFPFRARHAANGTPAPEREPVPAQQTVEPAPMPLLFAGVAPQRHRSWIPLAIVAALVLIAGGAWLKLLNTGGGVPEPARVEASPARADTFDLGLTATESGNQVTVEWNRRAPAVLEARRAVLEIQDGAYNDKLDLDGNRLREGKIVYTRIGRQVRFHLEVFTGERRSVSENLDFLTSAPEPAPEPAPVKPKVRAPRRVPEPVPQTAVAEPLPAAPPEHTTEPESPPLIPPDTEPGIGRPAPRR